MYCLTVSMSAYAGGVSISEARDLNSPGAVYEPGLPARHSNAGAGQAVQEATHLAEHTGGVELELHADGAGVQFRSRGELLTMPAMEGSVWLCSRQVTAPMERPHSAIEDSGCRSRRKAMAAVRSATSRAPKVTHSPSDSPEP